MNSITRGLKIPHREKDIKMAVRAASMMEHVWCQQLWGLRWEGELRLEVQNQPKYIVRSRINQSKRERNKRRKGKRRKSGERSRCVRSSFDVVYQVFLNHVSATEPELSSTWCCLRDQEGVGVWLLLPLLGLNKHCVVLCGIQLSKWVPKRLMQLLRRVG